MPKVTKEEIESFLNGTDPMEHIIKIECGYDDNKVSIIYRNEEGRKMIKRENFYPFLWTKETTAQKLFGGDRKLIRIKLSEYNIGVKGLRTTRDDGTEPERMKNGYKLLFYAKVPMTYSKFMDFFKKAGRPIYPKERDSNYGLKEYICISPVEQYMIQTGRRLFKGYDDYDDLLRMEWDLETEGLDPEKDAISQIGIRTNKGFEKIITVDGEGEEKRKNEFNAIREFFETIKELQSDVITGHNTENFDWNFIETRLRLMGLNMGEFSMEYFRKGVFKKKKQQVLKLGGEMEYFYPTVMWGTHLTDSLFAVRRAMAINSNIKSANLKYITKYSKINKENRVYVPGKKINTVWEDLTETYAFNNLNGEWFKVDNKKLSKTLEDGSLKYTDYYENDKHFLKDNSDNSIYEYTTGRYIVQRYLLDDLWESDKVEYKYNVTNYFVCKLLPVSYDKVCTMGTAAVWKYIMLAWSYQHDLAIPELIQRRKFCGGISRLLKTGKIKKQFKGDFSSLYPSCILTFGIKTPVDLMDIMLYLLEYLLKQRQYYKSKKKEAEIRKEKLTKEIEEKKSLNENTDNLLAEKETAIAEYVFFDNIQGCTKVICNGFFGSYGSGEIFPFSDIDAAENTTCIGRQALRLMIKFFTELGTTNGLGSDYNYTPVVGDSFTSDTPLFIRYEDSGLIDIKPISELISEKDIQIDALGREYDYSKKKFKVLCRSGWVEPQYIYRHKTTKPIYRVSDKENNMFVDVTEDHSLFNSDKEKIKPSEINSDTKLEYYEGDIYSSFNTLTENDNIKDTWLWLLNANIENKKNFIDNLSKGWNMKTKTDIARIEFIKKCVNIKYTIHEKIPFFIKKD